MVLVLIIIDSDSKVFGQRGVGKLGRTLLVSQNLSPSEPGVGGCRAVFCFRWSSLRFSLLQNSLTEAKAEAKPELLKPEQLQAPELLLKAAERGEYVVLGPGIGSLKVRHFISLKSKGLLLKI